MRVQGDAAEQSSTEWEGEGEGDDEDEGSGARAAWDVYDDPAPVGTYIATVRIRLGWVRFFFVLEFDAKCKYSSIFYCVF